MSTLISGVINFIFIGLYLLGLYVLAFDDHRYTAKDVVIGVVAFPYAMYVGGKQAYKLTTTSSESRKNVELCLDRTEAAGAPRKSRVRVCECIGENLANSKTGNKILDSERAFVACTGQKTIL